MTEFYWILSQLSFPCVAPLEPDKKPPGTEMFDRRRPLALCRRRPVTLVHGAVT